MKKIFFLILYLAPLSLVAQKDSLVSSVYNWKQPVSNNHKQKTSVVLFDGSTYDMKWLQMNADELTSSAAAKKMMVPVTEEQLYIIKKGELTVGINDSVFTLVHGSIILLLPGQNFSIQNKAAAPCDYYVMKYRSKSPADLERGKTNGGSFIKDWNNIIFKPNDKGGTRNYFQRPTAMTKRLDMHVTTLKPGLKSHEPHTHRAAEMVIMIDGHTEMQIGQKFYKGNEGDIYYLAANVLHGIRNIGAKPCTYFAIQFE